MDEKAKHLNEELIKYYNKFNRGTKQWSFAFHLCLYSSIISTLLIGFISQMKEFALIGVDKEVVVSFLAFLSAVLTGIIAKGGLDRNWKSNRINRGKVDGLRLDTLSDKRSLVDILKDLKTIIADHDKSIVGTNIEGKEQ